jgi:hypothetical protein
MSYSWLRDDICGAFWGDSTLAERQPSLLQLLQEPQLSPIDEDDVYDKPMTLTELNIPPDPASLFLLRNFSSDKSSESDDDDNEWIPFNGDGFLGIQPLPPDHDISREVSLYPLWDDAVTLESSDSRLADGRKTETARYRWGESWEAKDRFPQKDAEFACFDEVDTFENESRSPLPAGRSLQKNARDVDDAVDLDAHLLDSLSGRFRSGTAPRTKVLSLLLDAPPLPEELESFGCSASPSTLSSLTGVTTAVYWTERRDPESLLATIPVSNVNSASVAPRGEAELPGVDDWPQIHETLSEPNQDYFSASDSARKTPSKNKTNSSSDTRTISTSTTSTTFQSAKFTPSPDRKRLKKLWPPSPLSPSAAFEILRNDQHRVEESTAGSV